MALSGAMEAGRLDRTARVRALFVVPAFAACYVPLIIAGYALKEDFSSLTIIWPAAGVLLATLFFSPLRLWPALLITAQVGAFFVTSAIGAAAGALVGAWGAVHSLASAPYWHHWQLWWAGNWLGSLTMAPVDREADPAGTEARGAGHARRGNRARLQQHPHHDSRESQPRARDAGPGACGLRGPRGDGEGSAARGESRETDTHLQPAGTAISAASFEWTCAA